jgi:hypothetical protein
MTCKIPLEKVPEIEGMMKAKVRLGLIIKIGLALRKTRYKEFKTT